MHRQCVTATADAKALPEKESDRLVSIITRIDLKCLRVYRDRRPLQE